MANGATRSYGITWRICLTLIIFFIAWGVGEYYSANQGVIEGKIAARQALNDKDATAKTIWLVRNDIPTNIRLFAGLIILGLWVMPIVNGIKNLVKKEKKTTEAGNTQ